MTTDLTVTQLIDAIQKSKAQGITLFANGGGYIVGARWSAPAFLSLPQLQRFVDEINGVGRGCEPDVPVPCAPPQTESANAS